jgi:hypothetical protein
MFMSIIEITQQTNTNQVREGQNKLLSPKELMIQLHDMESEVGLRKAKEGSSEAFYFLSERALADIPIFYSYQHLFQSS